MVQTNAHTCICNDANEYYYDIVLIWPVGTCGWFYYDIEWSRDYSKTQSLILNLSKLYLLILCRERGEKITVHAVFLIKFHVHDPQDEC